MNRRGPHAGIFRAADPWHDDGLPDRFDLLSLGGGEPRTSQYTGLKALMVAMLEDAIECYLRRVGRTQVEAEHWITSPTRRPAFSFCVVCETLGLDPDAVRRAIQQLPRLEARNRRALPRSRPNARSQRYPAALDLR